MEKVVIESCASGSKVVFPIVRWMRAKDKLIIQNDSSLPQDDKHLNQRTQELEKVVSTSREKSWRSSADIEAAK